MTALFYENAASRLAVVFNIAVLITSEVIVKSVQSAFDVFPVSLSNFCHIN